MLRGSCPAGKSRESHDARLCAAGHESFWALPASKNERTSSGDVTRFSTASTTPCFVRTPMAVEPSCGSRARSARTLRQASARLLRRGAP